jgi:hypothetical protein
MLEFAIAPSSLRTLRRFEDSMRLHFGPLAVTALNAEAVAIAERLNENIKHEFEAGTDKEGRSHNKTGFTLESFHVEPAPVGASIIGEGGAAFVEAGFAPHRIEAGAGHALAFTTAGGERVFAHAVNHPGYRGDPFVQRAVKDTDLGSFEAHIVGAVAEKLFGRLF